MKQNLFVIMIAGLFLFSSFSVLPATGNGNDGVDADVYVDNDASSSWYDANHVKTIQEGIDNASLGNTVFVYKGIYHEKLVINKTIILTGENRNTTVIDGSGGEAIVKISASWVNLSGFTVQNSRSDYSIAGIKLDGVYNDVQHCHITNIIVSNNTGNGIGLSVSNNNTITNNNVSNNDKCGIELSSSNNNTIADNTVSNNDEEGVFLCSSTINTFTSSNNTFISNTVKNNRNGIVLYFSSDNTITSNIVSNNIYYGIYLDQFCKNNLIYHNNFINNSRKNAFDVGDNMWYNKSLQEGNYWGDYNGIDSDGDGIGNTPYNNQDIYPMIPINADINTGISWNELEFTISNYLDQKLTDISLDMTISYGWLMEKTRNVNRDDVELAGDGSKTLSFKVVQGGLLGFGLSKGKIFAPLDVNLTVATDYGGQRIRSSGKLMWGRLVWIK